MRTATVVAAAVWVAVGAPTHGAAAADVRKKAPDPAAAGEVFEWKSAGGVVCHWRAPRKYDAAKGAGLTVILHGSNLTHGWGFANHDSKTFRPDDFVLVPDGTTPNGQGGFNFLKDDTRKVRDLLSEVRKAVNVRGVYLYGHSQGSFFALQYAGDFPEDVTGVVAHASGLWTWTQTGPKGHGQAIVYMHGTQDPVVPYGQSVGGRDAMRKAGYPTVRLRSLEGWNHWPAEHNGDVPHTSQQLAWVEGMTTTDPARLEVSFATLEQVGADGVGEHDFAGLWSLAGRIEGMAEAPDGLKQRAAKARKLVEDLAQAHVSAIALPEKMAFEPKPWVGHLPIFLRAFDGVPAREELAKRLEGTLDAHREAAVAHLRKYWQARERKPDEAFAEAVAAVEKGFLWHECWDLEMRKQVREWRKDAKKLKLGKGAMKSYDGMFEDYEKALGEGWKAFEAVNRKSGGS
jgi:pimeloyl-ACP methyl ester carboxylesterase